MYTSIFFFLYLILFCAVLENLARKVLCTCVKTWITCWSWSVLLATDYNNTILHFDSLNKPDLSWPCGLLAVLSLTQSLFRIQWVSLFRSLACYYVLCFLRNQHTYPKNFTIVWSNMLHQNILTIHFFVLMSYNFHIWATGWQKGPKDKIWKFESDAYFKNSIHVKPFLKISMMNTFLLCIWLIIPS